MPFLFFWVFRIIKLFVCVWLFEYYKKYRSSVFKILIFKKLCCFYSYAFYYDIFLNLYAIPIRKSSVFTSRLLFSQSCIIHLLFNNSKCVFSLNASLLFHFYPISCSQVFIYFWLKFIKIVINLYFSLFKHSLQCLYSNTLLICK